MAGVPGASSDSASPEQHTLETPLDKLPGRPWIILAVARSRRRGTEHPGPVPGLLRRQGYAPERPQIGLDSGGKADAQGIGGDRVADADLGELRDRLHESRQVVEVEVVAGIDAEPDLRRRSIRSAPTDAAVAMAPGSGSMNRLTRAPVPLRSRITDWSERKLALTSQP